MSNKSLKGGNAQTTIAPVAASPANDAKSPLAAAIERRTFDPEFVDCPGLQALFGIKRSLAYVLLDAGLIRGVSLRRRGQTKGKRLIEVASVRAYFTAQMEAGK